MRAVQWLLVVLRFQKYHITRLKAFRVWSRLLLNLFHLKNTLPEKWYNASPSEEQQSRENSAVDGRNSHQNRDDLSYEKYKAFYQDYIEVHGEQAGKLE